MQHCLRRLCWLLGRSCGAGSRAGRTGGGRGGGVLTTPLAGAGDGADPGALDVGTALRSAWVWVVVITTGVGLLNFAVSATTRAAWGDGGIDRALVEELSGAWCVLPFTFAMIAAAIRFPVASSHWPRHLAPPEVSDWRWYPDWLWKLKDTTDRIAGAMQRKGNVD